MKRLVKDPETLAYYDDRVADLYTSVLTAIVIFLGLASLFGYARKMFPNTSH